MKLALNNKLYDFLKWTALIALPAASVLYSTLDATYGWGYSAIVSQTVNAVITFIGAIIGLSNANK